MNKFIFLFFLCVAQYSFATEFHCSVRDPSTAADLSFDSTAPTLTDGGGSEILLNPKEVCGVPVDFKSNCQTDLIHQGDEFNYSFRCDEVYGDLYFTALNGGAVELRCFGDHIRPGTEDRFYHSCTVH